MNYVSVLKRINTLINALTRAYAYGRRHPETNIDFDIEDKIAELREMLCSWINEDDAFAKRLRRKQIRTACKLLKFDVYEILP